MRPDDTQEYELPPPESDIDLLHQIILNAAPEMILTIDLDGIIMFANQSGFDICGYMPEELKGMNIADIMPPDQLAHIREAVFSQTAGFQTVTLYEAEMIDCELSLIPVEINARVLLTSSGQPFQLLLTVRDITRRKNQANHYFQAVKTQLIESVASGLSNDLSQLIKSIERYINQAHMLLNPETRAWERLGKAKSKCERVKALIRQLTMISGSETLIREVSSVTDVINQAADAELSDTQVKCEVFAPDDLWPAAFDMAQIKIVIRHLIRNAAEAMKNKGFLKIYLENLEIEKNGPVSKGSYVHILFQDQGGGIPDEYMERILDPYFSTKPESRGLGLTLAHAILRQHSGGLNVRSKPGQFAKVSLYLPKFGSKAHNSKDEPHVKGRVLIMDDEEIIRDVARQMIEKLGYEGAFVKDGTEAVRFYQGAMKSQKPFDAVILDLNVKEGMGAGEAIHHLLKIDPKVRAVVASGYSNDPEMTDFKKHGFWGMVEKPYSIRDLGEMLNRLAIEKKRKLIQSYNK